MPADEHLCALRDVEVGKSSDRAVSPTGSRLPALPNEAPLTWAELYWTLKEDSCSEHGFERQLSEEDKLD